MNKGFLNHSATASKDVDNDLIGKGSLLGDLASKIRNIDGKILGRDGKPMVARRCVRFADTTKESVCGDGRSVNNDSSMSEPSSQAVEQPLTSDHQKFMVHGDGLRPELRSIDEIKARFENTLYGFPVGKQLAFHMVENYVKHAWGKFRLKRVMMHYGFFMFQFDSKTGMEKVMEGGPWRIQLVPFILKVWMPNTLLKKEKVSNVPLWVKMHNVPIVAYSKVGLDLISAKVGRLMRLDAHTNFICLNSWGRSDYARALVEVSADKPLVDSVDIDIPRDDGKGYTTVNVRIEFEWQPPRCGTCKKFDHLESVCPMKRVAGPSKKSDMQADVKKDKRYIKGYRVNIPKSKLVYRAVVKPQGDNNVASNMEQSLDTTKKPSPSDSSKNDDICFDELRNFIDNGKRGVGAGIYSDTDVDEVFLPNDGIPFPSSSGGGGKPLEEDMLNAYDAYVDQFEEYPSSYQEFYDQFDFKVKGLVSSVFAITSTLPSIEPKDSLIMRDEHLSTFSIEEIVPIPRESEDTFGSDNENVLPSCDDFSSINVPRHDFVTFSNPLFEFNNEYVSSDVNPLFNKVLEDIKCKDSYDSNLDESTFLVTPLSDSNKDECLAPGSDIEFLLHHPSTPMKSVASILEGFIDEPPFEKNDDLFDLESIEVPTYIEECYYDSKGDVIYLESLLSDDTTHNLSSEVFFDHEPHQIKNEPDHDTLITFSPKSDPLHHEFAGEVITTPLRIVREHEDYISLMSLLCGNSSSQSPENSHTIIESLPTSTTFVEESDSNREEINIFSGPDDSIPPGIESDFDSEEDIIDNLLNDDPILEYERLTFDMEPDVPVINVDELNEDECFDPGGGEINVEIDDSFTFVIQTFLPYLTYHVDSPFLFSFWSEDTIFDPGIFT
ncbi:zinc knuckle CX2CX4HX4C containing protein [Tanacetum coccineum]